MQEILTFLKMCIPLKKNYDFISNVKTFKNLKNLLHLK